MVLWFYIKIILLIITGKIFNKKIGTVPILLAVLLVTNSWGDLETEKKNLESNDRRIRASAINNLRNMVNNQEAEKLLIEQLKKDPQPGLRITIIESLSLRNTSSSLQAIIDSLKDPSIEVRKNAVLRLGYYGNNPLVIGSLSNVLDSTEDESLQLLALGSLSLSTSSSTVLVVDKVIKDPKRKKQIKYAAMEVLLTMADNGNKKAEQKLKELEKDKNKTISQKAKQLNLKRKKK